MLREMRIEDCFHSFFTDCRFARRQLQKSPIFTTVAFLTLALGIGSSTAIFSTIDGTLLHPYPYKNAERLATFSVFSAEQFRAWRVAARAFVDLKGRNHTFDDMFVLVHLPFSSSVTAFGPNSSIAPPTCLATPTGSTVLPWPLWASCQRVFKSAGAIFGFLST